MRIIILSLITAGLLLTGCAESGGGGGGSGGGGGGGPGGDGGGGPGGGGGDGNGNGSNGDGDGGSGGGGGPSLPAEVELSISPFNEGLRIQWHNLPAIERAGGIGIHLNLTSNDSPPEFLRERITIENLTDNDNRYELGGLSNGTAYRLVGVAIELAGNISRVIDNITWSEPWQTKTNALDQEGNGIVVGANYDGDGRTDGLDGDIDDDGVNNIRTDGTVWDLCRRGELDWQSNSTSDHDGDGCRDSDEDWDNDNDGVNNTRTDGTVWDLCRQGELDWQSNSTNDYDEDGCRDSDEDWDNDNDGVNNTRTDGTEWDLCRQGELDWLSNSTSDHDSDGCRDNGTVNDGYGEDEDDDNDEVADSMDTCPVGQRNWRNDGTNDFDGDGCRNDEDPDRDNDGIPNEDEVGNCDLAVDCDGDGLDDGDEPIGCVENSDCDNDMKRDSEDSCPAGLRDWRNDGTNDVDGDGCRNDEDIDDDGDGLIEIGTAEELDAVRHVLDGTGFKADAGAMLNQTGCGGGEGMTVCNGYELVRDISLTDYIADNYPTAGWQPIAHHTRLSLICKQEPFTGIFDGNGFEVRGLFINRSQQDCIGLFGQATGTIRHLGVIADRVIGRNIVGGLVGGGDSASIIQSYAVSNLVRGAEGVGGLLGRGISTDITQSYVVHREVTGGVSIFTGGLVGNARAILIIQSYAVSGIVRAGNTVGGMVGQGLDGRIIQSYAVSGVLEVIGGTIVGGLVGESSTGINAYWDKETSGRNSDGLRAIGSSGQTTMALRSPTDYGDTGIYSTWDDGAMVDGINDNTTIWCDEDASGMIEDDERRGAGDTNGDNRVWDFGTTTDYPALRCTGDSLADQRAWWYLNTTSHKPQLNQTRLDAYLNSALP